MAAKRDSEIGFGKLLDAWNSPEDSGAPIGCICTTFTFKPSFYEEECLGRFLGMESDPVQDGPVYLIEREEKLSQVICAAVLVDQHHCGGVRSLRWDLLPARLSGAILHSKICLLAWQNWTRLIISSANLTEDGYRRNLEIFGVLDYHLDSEAPLVCLKQTVQFLRNAASFAQVDTNKSPPSMGRWNNLLDRVDSTSENWGTVQTGRSGAEIRIYPVFSGSEHQMLEQLKDLWPGSSPSETCSVISPFFDPPSPKNEPAQKIWSIMKQRGRAVVNYFVTAEEVADQNTLFVHAPESLMHATPKNRQDVSSKLKRVVPDHNRPLHAKLLVMGDSQWLMVMIGSSNFTSAGLGLSSKPNLEANLAYIVNKQRHPKIYKQIRHSIPNSEDVPEGFEVIYQPPEKNEDAADSDLVLLPHQFTEAIFDLDENDSGRITLHVQKQPPEGWEIFDEHEQFLFNHEKWDLINRPSQIILGWSDPRPPSALLVTWKDAGGLAWWPICVDSMAVLPPPMELKDLPLEILINILTSASPLHKVLRRYWKRDDDTEETENKIPAHLDPHRRVDTKRFLLQRTRRISWALAALRERMERPVPTEECLQWRLKGPVGVAALADAVLKEAVSDEERAFLVSELALELARVKPQDGPDCVSPNRVKSEIKEVISQIKDKIPRNLTKYGNLKDYVDAVFKKVG